MWKVADAEAEAISVITVKVQRDEMHARSDALGVQRRHEVIAADGELLEVEQRGEEVMRGAVAQLEVLAREAKPVDVAQLVAVGGDVTCPDPPSLVDAGELVQTERSLQVGHVVLVTRRDRLV